MKMILTPSEVVNLAFAAINRVKQGQVFGDDLIYLYGIPRGGIPAAYALKKRPKEHP